MLQKRISVISGIVRPDITPSYAQVWCTGSGGGLVLGGLNGLAIPEADALDELTQAF